MAMQKAITSSHPRLERTFVIIKPDGVQRSLVGQIISRFEQVGLKLIGIKMVIPTEKQCLTHYNKDDSWFLKKGSMIADNRKKANLPVTKEPIEYGRDIIRALVQYMTAGPVVAMIWQGCEAVHVVKKLVGETDPRGAGVGTIRGDFSSESYQICDIDGARGMRNLVHCTDNPSESQREIDIWFTKDEIASYTLLNEAVLYEDLSGQFL